MAEKETRRTEKRPPKPSKGAGEGDTSKRAGVPPESGFTAQEIFAMGDSMDMSQWKVRKEKLSAAKNALWNLPASEYGNLINDVIRTAPTSWHVQQLVIAAVRHLKRLSAGAGEAWSGIPANDAGVIGRAHYQLARITREFNIALTEKSTPAWLLKAKENPEFQKAWKEFSLKKKEHERGDSESTVIELDTHGGQRLRCEFGKKQVRMEWWRGDEPMRCEIRQRVSSNHVLQSWLCDVLKSFDEQMDCPGAPLSQDWSERWADEDRYIKHFLPHAESEWNPDQIDELQARAGGLLTTNNSLRNGRPRYDFGVFKTRIKRLAKNQIRLWRHNLTLPAPKVSP
jgi:hypothetical protein